MSDQPQPLTGKPLSEQDELFCQAYSIYWNGRKAYLEAVNPDVTASSAISSASKMNARPEIQARIQEIVDARKAQFNLDGSLVIHELMTLAFSSIGILLNEEGEIDTMKLATAPDNLKRALESVETTPGPYGTKTKVKMYSKLKALELLGKTRDLRLFIDSQEISDPNGEPLSVQVTFKRPEVKNV